MTENSNNRSPRQSKAETPAEAPKSETFRSTATIYQAGSGHPFNPGEEVQLHPDHASDFRKAGLEHKAGDKTDK